MVAEKEKIVIGKILRPHGVKGFARVLPLTDDPARFRLLEEIWLQNAKKELLRFAIETVTIQQRIVLLKLQGIDSRDLVESLRDLEIVIDRKDCLPLEEGAHYIFDLIGLKVLTTSGQFIGRLEEVLEYPASDIFVVRKDEQEILIPAVAQFIKEINLETATLIIEPIEGLLP